MTVRGCALLAVGLLAGCQEVGAVARVADTAVSDTFSPSGARPAMVEPEGEAAETLRAAVSSSCLAAPPTFHGVRARMVGEGWTVHSPNAFEHELRNGPMHAYLELPTAPASAFCRIEHPGVTREMANAIVEQAMRARYGARATWERGFGGVPWIRVRDVPADLVAWTADSGAPADATGAMISFESRYPQL